MATPEHTHDEMWRTPIPARTDSEEEPAEGAARFRIPEEHAVEDAWYQVLRRKHVEEIEDAEGA